MNIGDRIGIGRGGAGGRWPRVRLHRPTGIRNGGLLLVLVALAAMLALVDQPPQPGTGRRLPGLFQYLPPPVGITATPLSSASPCPPPPVRRMAGDSAAVVVDARAPAPDPSRPVASGP